MRVFTEFPASVHIDEKPSLLRSLEKFLKPNFTNSAAKIILENQGTVFITTGFYIVYAKASVTDGPPGAIALGNALKKIGYKVEKIFEPRGRDYKKEKGKIKKNINFRFFLKTIINILKTQQCNSSILTLSLNNLGLIKN